MRILGISTCSRCKKTYLGDFKVDITGEVTCHNCNEKVELTKKLIYKKAESVQEESAKFLTYFYEDITVIYNLYKEGMEDPSAEFYVDNQINLHNLYYMGNDLAFCEEAHIIVHKLLKYIDTPTEQEHNEYVDELIIEYMNLRRYKFSNNELELYKEKLFSKKTTKIISDLKYL